ncbi:conjugal transfer protein, partial [Acinetobacter baumannii]|nr:conjugal transfer protein [Acinetobacter baumannii]
MKKFFTILFLLIFTNLSFAADSGSNNNGSKSLRCPGEFANPISDICWSCIFPISMG